MKVIALLVVLVACAAVPSSARGVAPPGVHRIVLPEPRVSASGRDWADVDAAPGEEPSPAHPRGTVVVAEAIDVEPSPSVTEWDLATGALVRSAPLPLPAVFVDIGIAHAGGAYHVVASAGADGEIAYARLTGSLGLHEIVRLGAGERARIATDGNVVAVLWSGRRDRVLEPPGWQLVIFEASGERSAALRITGALESTFSYGQSLVVSGGKIFVLVPDDRGPRVVRFDTRGDVEGTRPLSWTPDDGRLLRTSGRVLFTDDCTVVELWPEDRGDSDRRVLPGPRRTGRACPAFQAAGDDAGRLVTTAGDVLSADLRIERHLPVAEGRATRALWVGPCPALLVVGAEGGRACVVWGEPDESFLK